MVFEDAAGVIPLSNEWLSARFALFEKFCLPSVQRQTRQEFKWLVFFDKDTPKEFKTRIDEYATYENFVPIFAKDWSHFKRHIADNMRKGAEYLITTRLDNDDSLHMRFIEKLQSLFSNQDLEFVNFPRGYVLQGNRIFVDSQPSNPFISLIERADDFKTVWVDQHTKLSHIGNIREVDTEPLWVQVIHGKNLVNRAKGKIRPPWALLSLKEDFAIKDSFTKQVITGIPAYVLHKPIEKLRESARSLGLRSTLSGVLKKMRSVI